MDKAIKSAGSSAEQIIEWGTEHKIETCFDRAAKMKPCPIGEVGACCKVCHMGPCRLVGKNAEEDARGVCGATLATVAPPRCYALQSSTKINSQRVLQCLIACAKECSQRKQGVPRQ